MRYPVEVSQFIIVPPAGRHADLLRRKELFKTFLMRRFPRYAFDIAVIAVLEEDDHFVVVPIMNYVTPDGDSYMCNKPPRSIIAAIAQACVEFTPPQTAMMVA